jgi:hypothetical protein
MPTEVLGRLDAFACDADADPAAPEIGATARDVVRLVGVELGRPRAGATGTPAWADDGRDRLDQRLEDARIVQVGCRELDRQWDALAINDQVVLRAKLPAVGGVPPGSVSPFFARTLVLSRLARSQSTAPSSPSQFKIV